MSYGAAAYLGRMWAALARIRSGYGWRLAPPSWATRSEPGCARTRAWARPLRGRMCADERRRALDAERPRLPRHSWPRPLPAL